MFIKWLIFFVNSELTDLVVAPHQWHSVKEEYHDFFLKPNAIVARRTPYRRLLRLNRFVGSMSRKGNCWDNSVAESFFGRLKEERVNWHNYQTRHEAREDILSYIIMFYNSQRLHSTLGYQSPNQFENQYWELMNKVA